MTKLKKVLKIKQNIVKPTQNVGSQLLYILFSFLILVSIVSCDLCTGIDNGGNDPEEEIYFSAIPENSEYPNIYKIGSVGESVKNIISNGIIFSPPSTNGKIAYIRINELDGNKNYLLVSNYDGTDTRLVATDNDIMKINYPVISPNGKYLNFNAGNNRLFYFDLNTWSAFNQITGILASGCIPSFSNDSKYLAFVDGDGVSLPYTIKIVTTDSPDVLNIVYQKTLGNVKFTGSLDNNIKWSADSKSIIYSLSNNNEDLVCITDITNSTERVIKIPNDEIGGNSASLAPNNDFISIAGKDGNIWIVFVATNELKFSKVTDTGGFEKYSNPKWSTDGNKLTFSSTSQFDTGIYSSLICSEIQFNSVLAITTKSYILSNNVYQSFWNYSSKK